MPDQGLEEQIDQWRNYLRRRQAIHSVSAHDSSARAGATPKRVAVLYLRFLRGRGAFPAAAQWQTNYLPAYALWAATVVVVFPPLSGFE